MSAQGHVLTATDGALQAFFIGSAIGGLEGSIYRLKESADKFLPVLICASESAARKRAKNWLVTGSIILKMNLNKEDNTSNLTESTETETAVLNALEAFIPDDDRPQPLADAITYAGIAAGAVAADEFLMTAFTIGNVGQGYDEDGVWTFTVDFSATVIA